MVVQVLWRRQRYLVFCFAAAFLCAFTIFCVCKADETALKRVSVPAGGDAVLLVREKEGFAARRLQGIRTVKISPNGRIVVVHLDGVAALDPELVPESFLRSWKISPDDVRQKQKQREAEQLARLEVRAAALRDSFPWMWQPSPVWGKKSTDTKHQPFGINSLPWTDEDENFRAHFSTRAGDFRAEDPAALSWWGLADVRSFQDVPADSAVLRVDSRMDVSNFSQRQAAREKQETDLWLEEALPRAEGFEVWRDVWSEFPLVEISELLTRPQEHLDRMVRVRGRLGNLSWGRGLEFFDISDGVRNFRVIFSSLLQASAIEKGLEDRMSLLRSMPADFSRDVTVVGEVGVEQGGRVFLDLIDFTF
jgi:hypothetical protein